jgi:hypothetical protein
VGRGGVTHGGASRERSWADDRAEEVPQREPPKRPGEESRQTEPLRDRERAGRVEVRAAEERLVVARKSRRSGTWEAWVGSRGLGVWRAWGIRLPCRWARGRPG